MLPSHGNIGMHKTEAEDVLKSPCTQSKHTLLDISRCNTSRAVNELTVLVFNVTYIGSGNTSANHNQSECRSNTKSGTDCARLSEWHAHLMLSD